MTFNQIWIFVLVQKKKGSNKNISRGRLSNHLQLDHRLFSVQLVVVCTEEKGSYLTKPSVKNIYRNEVKTESINQHEALKDARP